jgi:hypothetical protein
LSGLRREKADGCGSVSEIGEGDEAITEAAVVGAGKGHAGLPVVSALASGTGEVSTPGLCIGHDGCDAVSM